MSQSEHHVTQITSSKPLVESFYTCSKQVNLSSNVTPTSQPKTFLEFIHEPTNDANTLQHPCLVRLITSLLKTQNGMQASLLYPNLRRPYKHKTSNTFLYFTLAIKSYYIVPTCLFLTLGGDIELNPRPLRNILRNHPQDHKLRSQIYFTPHTIQIKLEYQQLQTLFKPYLISTHP